MGQKDIIGQNVQLFLDYVLYRAGIMIYTDCNRIKSSLD